VPCRRDAGKAPPLNIADLIALLVALIPTTIGALLSAIGIAGIDRTVRFNVLAMSGKAIEAAGDVQILPILISMWMLASCLWCYPSFLHQPNAAGDKPPAGYSGAVR